MCRTFALLCCLAVSAPLLECQEDGGEDTFSPDQLDNLLAPVALYPDPLLAQLLVAATFPDEIDEAARALRADPDPAGIDAEDWDVSVKAVAHYPEVLSTMADSLDWTTALGQAYAWQPDDVMASIQRLRAQASAVGNLESGPQQEVVNDAGNIEIWPAQADNIYVPAYDPDVVYFGSGGALEGGVEAFGPPWVIGVWLNRDIDWHHRKIYYHGWDQGPGWVTRSRPDVKPSPVYVNRSFQQIATGRAVRSVKVNREALNRYSSVHREPTFNREEAGVAAAGNKIIQRNIDTRDPRIDAFRGVEQPPATAYQAPAPRHEAAPQVQKTPAPESRPLEIARPVAQPPEREIHEPERVVHMPESIPKAQPSNEAFGNRGPFEPQAASQRGQASRSEMAQPAPRHASPPPPRATPAVRDK
jgi:Protein of unknown function (DUF3300)